LTYPSIVASLDLLLDYITNYVQNILHINHVGLQPIYFISCSSAIFLPLSPLAPSSSFLLYQLTLTGCDLRFSVALYVILSISISHPRSHSAVPLAPSDLGRSRPANWLRVIDALAEYWTSPEPIIYCSALYNVIIAGSYSTLAFSPFSLSFLSASRRCRELVKQTSRLIDSCSLKPISKPLPRSWKCTFQHETFIARLNNNSDYR